MEVGAIATFVCIGSFIIQGLCILTAGGIMGYSQAVEYNEVAFSVLFVAVLWRERLTQ